MDVVDVVLIDDSADIRHLVASFLRLTGRFRVVAQGSDGPEAIELAARHRPAVMVVDTLRSSGDVDALPGILAASPSTRVVVFSGDPQGARAIALGASDYVQKGGPTQELIGRLLALIAIPDERTPEGQ